MPDIIQNDGLHGCVVHPGFVLREYLKDVTVTEAARRLGVTRAALSRILNGRAAISADMAIRLSILLNTGCSMWKNMQNDYDLTQAQRKNFDCVVPLSRPFPAVA